ncbi:MAG: hypothetical protein IJW25_01550 [Clostridia bacterium]|nr:hypothetical protein [Clostridia bacterium]
MNKKVSLILAIFVALVSIVLVSTFGLIPEDLRENTKMEQLYFNLEPNANGAKVLVMNFKANNNTVNLYDMIVYLPYETTNITLQYTTDQAKGKVVVSSTGILTIYDLSLKSFNVYVKSTDGSNLEDKLTIKKPESNESNFGDDFIWG